MPDVEECFHTIVREGGREEAGKKKRQKVLLEKKEEKRTTATGKLLGLLNSRRPFKESIFLKDWEKKRKIKLPRLCEKGGADAKPEFLKR